MQISIIGCEQFDDYQVFKWHLEAINATKIITCGEHEVDKLAERYARDNNIPIETRWPEHHEGWFMIWKEYFMLIESCEALVAFWYGDDDIVPCITNKAKRMGKKVMVVRGYHVGKPSAKKD